MKLVLFLFLLLVFAFKVEAATVIVPDSYPTIQQAVNAASDGDTIVIRDGVYIENIKINKSIIIKSENGPSNCIVEALDTNKSVFNILADGVRLEGFTIKNANCRVCAGVLLNNSSNSAIANCIITNSSMGVCLIRSSNISVRQVNATNDIWGFVLWMSNSSKIVRNVAMNNAKGAILLYRSHSNTILTNDVYNNSFGGIRIFECSNNIVSGNEIKNCGSGIYFHNSVKSAASNNILSKNDLGIKIENCNKLLISGNIVTGNTGMLEEVGKGIFCINSSDIVMVNNKIGFNRQGIHCTSSLSLIIANNLIENNDNQGISLGNTMFSLISGNYIKNNGWDGIVIHSSSNNNEIKNNVIYNNGIKMGGGMGIENSSSNLIYNNIFNNSNNFWLINTSNTWNVKKTYWRNIVGGKYIGGNVWLTPDGSGYSQTCRDYNNDGVCDVPMILKNGNVDFLPLAINP